MLAFTHEPLLDSISAQALPKITEFDGQECANTAFAFAPLAMWHHGPLFNAIAAQSIRICSSVKGQSLRQLMDVFSELLLLGRRW